MVICGNPRKRYCGLVTILTWSGRRDVVGRFAHDPGVPAAMAARTAGRDPRVIHRRSRPEGRRRLMAGFAALRGWEVGRWFAQRRRAVMTGYAASRDPRVVIASGHKDPICRSHTVA